MAQKFVPLFTLPEFVGTGEFALVPKGFVGRPELGLPVALVGRGELVLLLVTVGCDKFGLPMGVVGPGEEVVASVGIAGSFITLVGSVGPGGGD